VKAEKKKGEVWYKAVFKHNPRGKGRKM